MTNNKIIIFLIGLFVCISISDAYSQRRPRSKSDRTEERERQRTRRSRDVEKVTFKDKLAWDILIGQLGFNQGFSISGKGGPSYKITDRFSVGLGLKLDYQFVNNPSPNGDDISLFNYGPYIFPRFKFSENIYIKGEYYLISYDCEIARFSGVTYPLDCLSNVNSRLSKGIPMLGLGYASGFGPWKFGLELMFIPVDNDRPYFGNNVFEYMFSGLYNF